MPIKNSEEFFPDYDLNLDITWVTIVPNTRPCYYCKLRQKIDGIPILMGAGDITMALMKKNGVQIPEKLENKGERIGDALDLRYGILLHTSMADIKYSFDR